jgi:hypothetical protein
MSRRPTTFRKRDITAAVAAMTAAGYNVTRVEIDRAAGKIVLVTSRGAVEVPEAEPAKNEWDEAV